MLSFRPATRDDIPTLRKLADTIWHACYADMLSRGQIEHMLAWMYAAETLERQMEAGVGWELAVDAEGNAVGFLSTTLDAGAERMELNKLYLLPAYHGRGNGQALLRHVLAKARAAGTREVHLRVNKRNQRAIAAYERAGFRTRQSLVQDIGGGFVMDDFIMARTCID